MPDLTLDELTTVTAVIAGVAVLALLVVVGLALRLRKLRRDYVLLRGDGDPKDIASVVGRGLKQIDGFNRRLDGIVADQEHQGAVGRLAVQRLGIVRYDAFEEMGGRLSFSAALLDDHGNGLVITSINGRTETRTYAKEIREQRSEHNLSEEERAAIEDAMSGGERSRAKATASR